MTVLLALATLAAFLAADFFLQRARRTRAARAAASVPAVPAGALPARVRLLSNHTWVRPEADGTILLGIDDFLARALGAVERIVLPEPGSVVGPARPQFAFAAAGRQLPVASPLTGRTLEVNRELLRSPGLAAQDPYQRGWLVRIAPADPAEVSAHEVEKPGVWLREQWAELRDFAARRRPDTAAALLQDGGMPVEGILQQFDAAAWEEFAARFTALPAHALREDASC